MSILVTGATGFLGSALTTQLLKQKQPVRILARDEQKARMQFGEAVMIIRGDITDLEQVERAVDGSTIIYHLAGRLYHPSVPAEFYHYTHVEGTRNLLKACKGQKQFLPRTFSLSYQVSGEKMSHLHEVVFSSLPTVVFMISAKQRQNWALFPLLGWLSG